MKNTLLASLSLVLASGLHAGNPDFVQTSAAGDQLKALPAVKLVKGKAAEGGITVTIDPKVRKQTLEGIGGALTESSAFVLANVSKAKRDAVLDKFYKPTEANFTLARTHIGSCDFSVIGRTSYDDTPGDTTLAHFSIQMDKEGFKNAKDTKYDQLPLIKDALARQPQLKILSSPWSAPAWMKDNNSAFGNGKGGALKPEHYDTFARYIVKYLQAYQREGVKIWALTPENEPLGNGGQWESMDFTGETERDFIKQALGPQLAKNGLGGVKVVAYDHNRGKDAIDFMKPILGDPQATKFVWGTGLHWYSTTNSACVETMDTLHTMAPAKALLHTEGCIDGIATKECSPDGKFLGWKNDAWWWKEECTDWGFYWASDADKPAHPKYAPVHRVVRDLVDGLNHWFVGWIDWNIVLDKQGGPNHVKNFCAAPVMIDTDSEDIYYTPLYYAMSHFSRYLQPGDHIVQVDTQAPGLGADDFHATAALSKDGKKLTVIAFNKAPKAVTYTLKVGAKHAAVEIPANALQTLRFNLAK